MVGQEGVEGGGSGGAAPMSGRCLQHPERPSVGRCEGCGAFRCAECSVQGSQLCPACRDRMGWVALPFDRTNWRVLGVFEVALEMFKRAPADYLIWGGLAFVFLTLIPWVLPFAGFVVTLLVPDQPGLIMAAVILCGVLNSALGMIAQQGLIVLSLDRLQGRSRAFWPRVGYVLRRLLVLLGAGLTMTLAMSVPAALLLGGAVGVGYLLSSSPSDGLDLSFFLSTFSLVYLVLFPLLLYLFVRFAFLAQEVFFDPSCGPIEALRRAWRLTEGQWFKAAGLLLLSGLVTGAGAMACLVGLAASYPLSALIQTVGFLAMRRGSGLPAPRG